MFKFAQHISRSARHLVAAFLFFLLTLGIFAATLFMPGQSSSASAQAQETTPTPASGMQGGMMGQGMSMAEMGAMMDTMMANMQDMMANMPMSGTMPMFGTMSMSDMGQMMQMMGMMHQQMGQMQMMMGTMMSSGMGEGMMGEGMPMHEMGDMMQMMGMMHQQMAMMHMMGAMMSGKMMGDMMSDGMMGQGMGSQVVTPKATESAPMATATAKPAATATVTDTGTVTDTAAAKTVPEVAASTSGHPDHPLATTSHSATAGAVTVEVVPLTDDEILDIAFSITLETHSVELDFDLAAQAKLIIGEAEFAPTGWEPNASDGHHVAGTLTFTIDHPAHAELGKVEEVTLDLGEIDGQPVTLKFAVAG